ncbi:MAG: hypothetical protein R3E62_10715 [Pseudomonadales bacterium]
MTRTTRASLRAYAHLEKTQPVLEGLLDQYLTNKEIAEELNTQGLYMPSGASWNAVRIGKFLHKHQIKPTQLKGKE